MEELPKHFEPDMKVGDELIVLNNHVRISRIEVVVYTQAINNGRPVGKGTKVIIPVNDFQNPFPWRGL